MVSSYHSGKFGQHCKNENGPGLPLPGPFSTLGCSVGGDQPSAKKLGLVVVACNGYNLGGALGGVAGMSSSQVKRPWSRRRVTDAPLLLPDRQAWDYAQDDVRAFHRVLEQRGARPWRRRQPLGGRPVTVMGRMLSQSSVARDA